MASIQALEKFRDHALEVIKIKRHQQRMRAFLSFRSTPHPQYPDKHQQQPAKKREKRLSRYPRSPQSIPARRRETTHRQQSIHSQDKESHFRPVPQEAKVHNKNTRRTPQVIEIAQLRTSSIGRSTRRTNRPARKRNTHHQNRRNHQTAPTSTGQHSTFFGSFTSSADRRRRHSSVWT